MESLIDSMTGPASWPFWIGIGFGLLLYGLDRLTTWRYTRRVEKRLYTLRRVYWPREEQQELASQIRRRR